MKRKWLLLMPVVLVALVPILSQAQRPAEPATVLAPIEVYFSPKGGCTDAIVRELGTAKTCIRVQAYELVAQPGKAIWEMSGKIDGARM